MILVATWGDGVFAVRESGQTHELANQAVRGLAVDGHGGALAIVGGRSLCRRGPGGEWTTLATSEVELSCCLAVGDEIYVGTDDARMLRMSSAAGALATLAGFDEVPGRDTWFAGSAVVNGKRVGPPLGIRSLAANPDGSLLFANVHVGGIPRSFDGGRTWKPTIDIQSDVHEVCAHPTEADIVVAASAVGLCISRDAGMTWRIEREGMHAAHCSAVAIAGDDVLVSAARDPFVGEGRIYRRTVKALESPLVAVEDGLPTWTKGIVHTGCIAVSDSSVAIADRGGNVYGSEDYGRTWSCKSTGLPMPSGVVIC